MGQVSATLSNRNVRMLNGACQAHEDSARGRRAVKTLNTRNDLRPAAIWNALLMRSVGLRHLKHWWWLL